MWSKLAYSRRFCSLVLILACWYHSTSGTGVLTGMFGVGYIPEDCVFPFQYKGRLFWECTTVDNNGQAWCSTHANYDISKEWKICVTANWSYSGRTGPEFWGESYPICGSGQHQSPINIDVEKLKRDENLRKMPLSFYGYENVAPGEFWTIKNNGYTVEVDIPDDIAIYYGPLAGTYKLSQFHMHWGSDDSKGSEHTVNGCRFPVEVHMVHYSDRFSSLKEAADKEGGVAVLTTFVEVSDKNNNKLQPFFDALQYIEYKNEESLLAPFPMRHLVTEYSSPIYYTYHGSLTTPGCYESVQWIILDGTLPLSSQQIAKLRTMKFGERGTEKGKKPMVNNWRPLQKINGRVVRTNLPETSKTTNEVWFQGREDSWKSSSAVESREETWKSSNWATSQWGGSWRNKK